MSDSPVATSIPSPEVGTDEVEVANTAELPSKAADATELKTLKEALAMAAPKPGDDAPPGQKIAYATALSGYVAKTFANGLKSKNHQLFGGSHASEQKVGKGTKVSKKIDVLLATEREGMKLNISIKTQSFRDFQNGKVKQTKAFCHNLTRIIDQELQLEAKKSHQLFPFALLVGVVLFPAAAWFDSVSPKQGEKPSDSQCSSAAEFAQRLRAIAGRTDLRNSDQESHFEAIFIAAHGIDALSDAQKRGFKEDVAFFNVASGVPHEGLPKSLLTYSEFLDAVIAMYNDRWHARREWDDEV